MHRPFAWSTLVVLSSALSFVACAPMEGPTDGPQGTDATLLDRASQTDTAAIEDSATQEDTAIVPMDRTVPPTDTRGPVSCVDWCTYLLVECGDPPSLANNTCVGRCGTIGNPQSAVACLRMTSCLDLRAAISRGTTICDLTPPGDGGTRTDAAAPTDARTDATAPTDARTDAATDARTDAATDARTDAATDARTDAAAPTDARTDAVTDARTDAVADTRG
ncbi:MAG: hypothetical protein Q8Q09_04840 [Deltaproteobacteria bacterium]|nr:hypothetical protein [Deltaproteobacteria bacterium]